MRVGKKATVVEAKKTRSCVVRLEKVPSPPTSKMTRSGATARTANAHPPEERKFKGPLKKRPLTQTASPSASSSTSAASTPAKSVKEKLNKQMVKPTPQKVGRPRASPQVVDDTPPPTIAAGRSRRAIKPNPKYASDDMVTPKIIKNVAILGASGQKKGGIAAGHHRKRSTSSEDFYNKESSDEGVDEELNTSDNKSIGAMAKETDSDFSDIKVPTPVRKRGRPRREDVAAREANANTPSQSSKSATATPKNVTSQLQLLRKSLAANMNRTELSAGMKRKRDATGGSSDNDTIVASKRVLLSVSGATSTPVVRQKPVRELVNLNVSDSILSTRKSFNTQTLNGSRVSKSALSLQESSPASTTDKRKQLTESSAAGSVRPSPVRLHASAAAATTSAKAPNARLMANAKQRSASPATPKQTKAAAGATTDKTESNEKKLADSPSSTGDDFEIMPTFTIVNINDIINKKTDVLISKTKKTESPTQDTASVGAASVAVDPKLNRRKAAHGTILTDKPDAERLKSPLPRTPFPAGKRPVQKILNHMLAKRTPAAPSTSQRVGTSGGKAGGSSTSPGKPAPRILNAMVAKKTQPVKPMIANLDDSADESYPLSLDDDEELPGVEEEDDSFVSGKRKLPSSTPYPGKKPVPITKENSLAATNRLPTKPTTRKLSPERVVISRQGDKIIKKITCFETWYVINIPEDRPAKHVRNQLEIPLIQLANNSSDITLPAESWSCKVTLYKLSSTMLAKPNLTTYTGDLTEHNIAEEERAQYQPSCVMFRRAVDDRQKSRLPYDRAVIFKNKTFFTNIEGKNVKLVGAPVAVNTLTEVEILLQLVDTLTLQSPFVEPATTVQ